MIPKLYVSADQKRAVFDGKRCRFVPYKRNKYGTAVPPRGARNGNYCALCACYESSVCCRLVGTGFRDKETMCGVATRRDETYGYWKEIK